MASFKGNGETQGSAFAFQNRRQSSPSLSLPPFLHVDSSDPNRTDMV